MDIKVCSEMAEKRPGEIAQIEMFNPTCKKNNSYFMNLELYIEVITLTFIF